MRQIFGPVALLLLSAALAACTLPRGAALQSEVLRNSDAATPDFAVYKVTKAFLPAVARWPATGGQPAHGWITRHRGPAGQVIAPGDELEIAIWDSGDNSLMTAPEQKVATLSRITVSPQGYVFIPYLEEQRVAGMTPERARASIQEELERLIPSAQVQLMMTSGRRNSADLVGGVTQPGSYPLPDRDFTVLGLISRGGGVAPGLKNPQIRLMRDGRIYGTSIARLYAEPALDTTLRGGDKVIVEEDRRYFLSLGAAGEEDVHPFPRDRVSALDALSIIGGLSDNRADPKGILILREYPRSALAAGVQGPRQERVVFTLDLTSADGLFSARRFQVNPGDLVLATESPVTSARTILGLIGGAFGVASQAGAAGI